MIRYCSGCGKATKGGLCRSCYLKSVKSQRLRPVCGIASKECPTANAYYHRVVAVRRAVEERDEAILEREIESQRCQKIQTLLQEAYQRIESLMVERDHWHTKYLQVRPIGGWAIDPVGER